MSAAFTLRQLLKSGDTVVAPGAFDSLTSRIAQDLGFNAVYVGGSMTGAHLGCGEPLLTLTEEVEVAARVAKAVSLPVVVDAHTGFGEPIHNTRTVEEFEGSGVAAIHHGGPGFSQTSPLPQGNEARRAR